MKKIIFLVLVGFMVISCKSLIYKDNYQDSDIFAELIVEDDDWVVLTIRNNSTSQIQLLADKAQYTNVGTYENTILVPLYDNINPGTKVLPIPIQPGTLFLQRFVAPAYIEYERGKLDNINDWTPRNKNDIRTAFFSFEYEIEGEVRHFVFEQFR